jgi:hypothetical protein
MCGYVACVTDCRGSVCCASQLVIAARTTSNMHGTNIKLSVTVIGFRHFLQFMWKQFPNAAVRK